MPKKLLVYGAHFAEDLANAACFGWQIEQATFNWATLRDNVLAEVSRLSGMYTRTLDAHKVKMLLGHAVLLGPNRARVADIEVSAERILMATGARPYVPDKPGCELGITSNEAFLLESMPRRIVIAGAGYIANEFAGVFNQLGSKVILLNRSDQILRGYDEPMKSVLAGRNERALYKIVVDGSTDKVLGAHMIGPDAPEILQIVAVAVKAGLTKAQFDECIAIHPTMAEELVLLK